MLNISKKALKLSSLFFLVISNSCAQEPDFAVGDLANQLGGDDSAITADDTIETKAIVFQGRDLFTSRSCNVSLALYEDQGQHTWLSKVDYAVHGQQLPDVALREYRYDINTDTYHGINEEDEGLPALAGAVLNTGAEADLNQMANYINNNELVYSLRIDLSPSIDFESFEETMEDVIDDPSLLSSLNNSLSQIDRIVFRILHSNHYDAGGCQITQAMSVTDTTFNLEIGDHDDDHDHDHDHDDHDDDDHEDDDHDHDHDH